LSLLSIQGSSSVFALPGAVLSLSARKHDDVAFICGLPNQLPLGTVVIDDFHRLDGDSKKKLADLRKTLAHEGAAHSKLPNAGQSLIS
jgi:hypothetical protein